MRCWWYFPIHSLCSTAAGSENDAVECSTCRNTPETIVLAKRKKCASISLNIQTVLKKIQQNKQFPCASVKRSSRIASHCAHHTGCRCYLFFFFFFKESQALFHLLPRFCLPCLCVCCIKHKEAVACNFIIFLFNDNKAVITQMVSAQPYSCSLDHDLNSVERYYADSFICTDMLMNSKEQAECLCVCVWVRVHMCVRWMTNLLFIFSEFFHSVSSFQYLLT